MVTAEQAERLATNYINDLQDSSGIPLQIVEMCVVSRGWLFSYALRRKD